MVSNDGPVLQEALQGESAAVGATWQSLRDLEGSSASGLATLCLLCSVRSLSDSELATVWRVQLLDQVVA